MKYGEDNMYVEIGSTFIAVSDAVKVHIIRLLKEQQTQPRIKSIDRNDEQDSNNPPLLIRVGIILQMLINLQAK